MSSASRKGCPVLPPAAGLHVESAAPSPALSKSSIVAVVAVRPLQSLLHVLGYLGYFLGEGGTGC